MDEMRAEDLIMTDEQKALKGSAVQKIVKDLEESRVPDASVKLTKHTIHYESPAGNESPLPAAICSCGWKKSHARFQTVYQKALQHSQKTGHIMLTAKKS